MATRTLKVDDRNFQFQGISEEDSYFRSIDLGFEEKFQEFCRAYLGEDYVAFDIGGNIGVTSCILSHFLPRGKIYTFEPGPNCFARLQENLYRNSIRNVEAHNFAVSEKNGVIDFLENSAYGHIIQSQANSKNKTASDRSCQVYTIDALVRKFKLKRLDFIKIDVEGFEPQVFKGAQQSLKRFNPVIYFEFNSWCLLDHGKNNPLNFMQYISDNFNTVLRVVKSGEKYPILENRYDTNRINAYVHDNIAYHGSVDDFVVTNDEHKLASRYSGIMEKISSLSTQLSSAQNDLNNAVQQRDSLLQEISAVNTDRDAIKGELSAMTIDRDAIKGELAVVAAKRDAVKEELAAMAANRDAVKGELAAMAANRDAVKGELAAMTANRDAKTRELSVVASDRDAIRRELSAVISDRDNIKTELSISARDKEALNEMLGNIYQSRLWKLTRPLRVIYSYFTNRI